MARHGVDYESVKQAALKLLSQGISPSVQKIRDLLGTGSHTTIAEHLKNWREAQAAKKVHHLPATLPEELIATFETLWQTAMEHAEKHMTDIKEALEQQEEKLQQEKMLTDNIIADLKSQMDALTQKIEVKTQENQALVTKSAVANERFDQQAGEMDTLKQQYELRLNHLLDEKHHAIEKVDQLQTDIRQHQQALSDQTEKYQEMLEKERLLQEDSEKRWVHLIDQARSEAKNWRKKYEEAVRKQKGRLELLQNQLTAEQARMSHNNETINALHKKIEALQTQYTVAVSELAVLKAKLKTAAGKKHPKKRTESI